MGLSFGGKFKFNAYFLTMTKPLGGIHPIVMGETLY